jgi:hypothetical protein
LEILSVVFNKSNEWKEIDKESLLETVSKKFESLKRKRLKGGFGLKSLSDFFFVSIQIFFAFVCFVSNFCDLLIRPSERNRKSKKSMIETHNFFE